MRTLLSGLLLSFLLFSCSKKESVDPVELGAVPKEEVNSRFKTIFNCYSDNNPDSATIGNKLIGTWKLDYTYSWFTEEAIYSDKEVLVTFLPNHTLVVKEAGIVSSAKTWNVYLEGDFAWRLRVDPTVNFLQGRIFLCDKEVIFYNSYIDLLDYFFTKID